MIVQHNIMAINSHRQLTVNNSNLAKNLEKLSSGYRINKAADDAAGLAISEKMRAQITGLERAALNAQDGASLIQTAEGGLTEVHSMLNRLVELATQSANGTIQTDDRMKIEAEKDALLDEIDRISKATNFNGIALLDGSLGKGTATFKADNSIFAPGGAFKGDSLEAVITSITGITLDAGAKFSVVASAGGKGGVPAGEEADYVTFEIAQADGDTVLRSVKIEDIVSFRNMDGSIATVGGEVDVEKGAHGTLDLTSIGLGKIDIFVGSAKVAAADIKTALGKAFATISNQELVAADPSAIGGTGLTMQVGDTADAFNKITVAVDDMSAQGLDIRNISMADQTVAAASLDKIKAAIEKVSVNRGNLGALQNRLEHTISNLGVTTENMTAAESRIRDVDMAKEMMAFTKNNVLSQAAQAMLAQANQQPQQVLQLLR